MKNGVLIGWRKNQNGSLIKQASFERKKTEALRTLTFSRFLFRDIPQLSHLPFPIVFNDL